MQPLSSAPAYTALGWAVFPTAAGGKTPLTPHGCKDGTTDPVQLADWRRLFPNGNVALATGTPSGVWAIDCDGDTGRDTLRRLVAEYGPLPRTPRAISGGGGWHLYFRWHPERPITSRPVKGCPGIETRARGSSITLPPSLHRSGQRYRWVTGRAPWEVDVAEAPEWLLTLVDPPRPVQPMPVVDFTAEADRLRRYGKAALVRTCDELARTTSHRNCALNVAAFSLGRLIGAGCLDRAEVEPVLEGIAYQIGLEPGEIGATIDSGITAGQRQPRYPLAG